MSNGPLVHWTNGHKNVQSTFLCVQWTLWLSLLPSECLPSNYVHCSTGRMDIRMSNGHFYVSSGHYAWLSLLHQSVCHQTMSIGPLVHWTNGHKNVEWTFLCVQWILWLFNRQNTVTSAIRVLAIRQ